MQVLVIGAGVVGLAIARVAALAGHEVIVAEATGGHRQRRVLAQQRVIHAGMYYPTGSLRARHCVRGRRMLYDFCASHGVPHKKVGKLIVAVDEKQTAKIEGIAKQGEINGVEGLEFSAAMRRAPWSRRSSARRRCSRRDRHHRQPRLHAGAAKAIWKTAAA
jgi:L-2-hydroxyglutarate oxidase LhgO